MHTVQLLLKTSKYERHEIDRRFHALAHLHNVCVKHARKCMIRLQHDKRYAELRQLYNELVKKEKMSKEEKSQKKKLAKQLAACRTEQGLSKASLEHYLKVCGKQFSKLLSSQQVQAEADRVWCGVERCLFGNGKELHFKKLMDFDTIGGKSNKNGARFDLDAMYVNWLGLSLKCYLPKSENSLSYVWESLKGKISYCNIKRLMFSSGWRYYAEIVVSGDAPTRVLIGTSTMGIDPGVSTIAGVSEDACVLEELAPNAIQYEKKIQKISQSMDRSRRISNPNKYNEDGTINRSNRDPWKYSKNYVKMCRLLKSLYRKKHAYIVDSHRELCNKLITIAKYFPVEKMHFQALQKKAKETRRQEKKTEVKQKDGTVKVITTGTQYVYGKLDSSAKAMKAEGALTINGGTVLVRATGGEGSEGIESKSVLTVNDGMIAALCYDDCMNASNSIVINGGSIYCYSSGNDGIDSNGTLTITGGVVIASGTTSPEDGFDCDQNTFKITGGIVLGIGGGTSTPTSSVCTQRSVIYGGSGSNGEILNIQSADGTNVLTYQIPRNYSQMTLLFSSPNLASGGSYTISKGGSVSGGSEFFGLYTGSSYSGGTQAATFTAGSMVTQVGNVNSNPGGGQPGGGGRPGGW